MSSDPKEVKSPGGQAKSDTERTVAEVWREVLQTADLPDTADNFFALGGDSMTMTMAEFRIREELSIDLPAAAILRTKSLRELSSLIDATFGSKPEANHVREQTLQEPHK